MAKKRDTEEFQRMHRTEPGPRWDDADDEDPDVTTYTSAEHGPDPVPDWVITSDRARQYELGVLKTGKEADVYLVERHLDGEVNLLAAKRYRKFEDRMFRNDARYRGGRRTGESRVDKAIARGNRAGMAFRAQQWVMTEFEVMSRLWEAGVPVPYPVQKLGNELMLEFIGTDDEAAPRLVHSKPERDDIPDLWQQLVDALVRLVRVGVVHGDMSPYNILVHEGRLVFIDFPQAVDPIAHPEGMALLERDVNNICTWFGKRGVNCDPGDLFGRLVAEVTG
jgi:RIO kinase 1